MKTCALCSKTIEPGTPAVSVVGGMFPRGEEDFFMIDETVLEETHAHLPCFRRVVGRKPDGD